MIPDVPTNWAWEHCKPRASGDDPVSRPQWGEELK